ncbi:synapse-associated protein of 47 kDa isoform X3 [Athalia rosae]|uniref:synapse-associated protein of 47 kDa isoform X3 n=1 Tax=Athalia rosae TaxID=37344 RepID=UPI0020347CDE|nr:synapse-associated protein of 47 kDa isoform X3 [Athalia rosae]
MFSGLTSQVSTWMGKKNEDGTDAVPPEEKAASTSGTEGEFDTDKKDASPTKGSKLDMLAGVKFQMSGWLSGGIPGLSKGVGGPGGTGQVEGDSQVPISSDTAESQASRESVQGAASEHVKDDDASSATGGADSGPASLEGTPTDDKDGQQAFGAVSTKAIAGAKSLGGFLYSAVNKAGKSVAEASAKIKKTVEENVSNQSLLGEFNKEQDAFIASKQGEKGEAVAPWVGAPNEEALREECLALSTDRRNFVRAPPPGVEFVWDFEAAQPVAQATLALDPNLETMRFELVPKVISEENFWRNYFYRVSLLRQSHELNAMASQTESNQNLISAGSIDHTQDKSSSAGLGSTSTTGSGVNGSSSSSMRSVRRDNYSVEMHGNTDEQTESSSSVRPSNDTTAAISSAVETSPAHEFVSDTMRASDTDIQEVREGMKKLGMQPPKEEDWERELEAELRDFEVVPAGNGKPTSGICGKDGGSSTSALVRDDWEEQIDELLGEEDDLK